MRTLVVGDVHGCLDEFDQLLSESGFRRGVDRLILAGDMLDRGPDPVGVVRRARELGGTAVLGNHEERHVRWRHHEQKRSADPAYKNPMRPFSPQRQAEHDALSTQDWEWIEALPLSIRIDSRWVVVHAGLEPTLPFAEQHPNTLLRMRYVRRADDRMATLGENLAQPPDSDAWSLRWAGPESVIFGHHVHDQPWRHEPVPGVLCVGIDTGCCFGGSLSGAVIEDGELVATPQVPSREVYHRSSIIMLPAASTAHPA